MLDDFVHRSALSKVICRPGAVEALPRELRELGIERPFVLSGRNTARSSIYQRAMAGLASFSVREYKDVPEHSSVAAVQRIVEQARAHGADSFIAIGGGSSSDTAKAAALWLAEGGALEDHASRFTPPATLVMPQLDAPKLPIIAIPTTASGAEVTPSLGIRTDSGRKLLFTDLKLASRLIIIDSTANGVPTPILLSSGMSGLAHCIEGLYSKGQTPLSAAVALRAIGLFTHALPRLARTPDSVACRGALLSAAHLSGVVLMNSRTCLHHAICHVLGATTGVPHGHANSVMLPYVIAFNGSAAPERMVHIARAWNSGGDMTEDKDPADLTRQLQASIGVPTRLRDIGVPRSALADVAAKSMDERGVYFNPREVRGPHEIEALLNEAW